MTPELLRAEGKINGQTPVAAKKCIVTILGREGQKAHVMSVVNTKYKQEPLDVVYLFDPRPVLPADTVRSILDMEKMEHKTT